MSKKPILNDQQFSLHMQAVSDIYAEMQMELFEGMIQRLKKRGAADLERNPYVWQLEKLNDMHMLNEHNLKIITERTGIAESLLREVIANEGLKVYEDTRSQLADDLGNRYTAPANNRVVNVLESYAQQAVDDLNLINSTITDKISQTHRSIIHKAVAEVATGTKTAERALNDTVMQWVQRGFTGFVDKAGRQWRADVYARAVIKSTTYKVFNDMRTRPALEMGIDTFYYSMKAKARPACAPIQHKIVSYGSSRVEQGVQVHSLYDYGYGTAGGCLGIHCGHYLTPFVVGVNDLPDLPEYLKDLTPEQAVENAKIEAKQRALERTIRHSKERLHVAHMLRDDELIQAEKLRVRRDQAKMRALVDKYDFLNRDYNREKYFAGQLGHRKIEERVNSEFNELLREREKKKFISKN